MLRVNFFLLSPLVIRSDVEVTTIALSQDTSSVLSEEKPGVCPAPEPNTGGVCASTCKNDSECEGDKKCCANACGGTACTDVRSSNNGPFIPYEKPGICPKNKPGTFGICISQCANDYECKGNMKCCKNQCGGGLCVSPAEELPPKSGTCPAVKLIENLAAVSCLNECSDDSECPDDKKCCSSSCGSKICTAPVESNPPKTGNCPAIQPGEMGICAFLCSGDGSCDGTRKCCPTACGGTQCVEPEKPPPKSGTCPAVKLIENLAAVSCLNECSDDSECPDDKKCCSSSCGSKICTAPVESNPPKSGTCPAVKLIKNLAAVRCLNECSYDSECPDDKKCCSNSCGGRMCTAPVESNSPKPGNCPAVRPGEVGICANLCSGDGSCEGSKKCCPNGCGGTACVEPQKPAPKPGSCPAIKPGQVGTCALLCRDDSNCKGNLKCCSNGCGTKCTRPNKTVPKTGSCPATPPRPVGGYSASSRSRKLCSDDSSCPGKELCCSTPGGGTECVAPVVTDKLGRCPAIKPGEVSHCANLCSGDGSCDGDKKCCRNACGGSDCVTPERKPGTCPATPPGPPGGNLGCSMERRCSDDFACPGKKLCCRNSCGGAACVSPATPPPCPSK